MVCIVMEAPVAELRRGGGGAWPPYDFSLYSDISALPLPLIILNLICAHLSRPVARGLQGLLGRL